MDKLELTVTKSRTVKTEREFIRAEYTLKAADVDIKELDSVRKALEGMINAWLSELRPMAAERPHPSTLFPPELRELLVFEEHGDHWAIRPKSYLGENFSKVADIVKRHGGSYVSAGKESYFRLPKG